MSYNENWNNTAWVTQVDVYIGNVISAGGGGMQFGKETIRDFDTPINFQVNGKISHTEKQKTLCKLNGLCLTDELDNTIKNERNEADIQEIREGEVGEYDLQLIPERCDLFSKHRHTSLQFL